jgi:hypothetical protein
MTRSHHQELHHELLESQQLSQSAVRQQPAGKDVNAEAEEPTLLGAVT